MKFNKLEIVYYRGNKLTVVNNIGFIYNNLRYIPCVNNENIIDDYLETTLLNQKEYSELNTNVVKNINFEIKRN